MACCNLQHNVTPIFSLDLNTNFLPRAVDVAALATVADVVVLVEAVVEAQTVADLVTSRARSRPLNKVLRHRIEDCMPVNTHCRTYVLTSGFRRLCGLWAR